MSVLIKNMEMPKGCIYANDNDQTEYCPLLNHDDVPFCQYIESEPEIAIGIGERPVYCPLSDVPEPCENTVSRQAAIDVVMQYCPDDDGSCSKAGVDIREMLDELEDMPSAQPEQKWIPCSERLPEEKDAGILKKLGTSKRSEYVLATVEVKGERMTVTACTYDGEWHWDKKYAFPDYKIVAWMPLPEPYREGEQDENR